MIDKEKQTFGTFIFQAIELKELMLNSALGPDVALQHRDYAKLKNSCKYSFPTRSVKKIWYQCIPDNYTCEKEI